MPGSCCKFFALSFEVNVNNWEAEARAILDQHEIYHFIPCEPLITGENSASGMTRLQFTCTWLGLDGRCMNYAERPYPCYDYQPDEDGLCAEHVRRFKNIPIRVHTSI